MTHSPADKRITTTLSSPRDLAAAVPYLLGFHPRDSVIVISLKGDERRIGLTSRSDRSNFDGPDARKAADVLAALVVRDGGRAALVVGYAEDDSTGKSGGAAVHDAFAAAFAATEVELYDSLHVAGDRWWSLNCDDGACGSEHSGELSDPPGAGAGDFAFAAALSGVAPLSSREALVDSLRPAHAIARAVLAQAVQRHATLRAAARRRALDEAAHLSEVRARTLQLAKSAAASGEDGAIRVATEHMAELLTGLADVVARDMCIAWSVRDDSHSAVRLWTHLARLAPEPLDAAPLTLLAWCAYRDGNGALARVALDRALRSDPDYAMAQILTDGLDRAVEPRMLREVEQELCALLDTREPAPSRARERSGDGRRSVRRSRRRDAR